MAHVRKAELPVPPPKLREELKELVSRAAGTRGFRFAEPLTPLAEDEVVVAVIGRDSVALERKKASVYRKLRDGVARRLAMRIAAIDLAASRLDEDEAEERAREHPFSNHEQAALQEGGLIAERVRETRSSPVTQAQAEFARLCADALTVEQAARLLGVNTSRIRQRLTGDSPTLFGLKLGGRWTLPGFQFRRGRVVPGLDKVIPAVPRDLDPVSVHRWLTTPDEDLEIGGGRPVSPLDWLAMGRDPAAVVGLARDL
jgi:hypothetical protein